ncbi:MAG: dihydrodipicolinate synthase family protein, partial [Verrucomicrobia bacterium]|nr:dihydrodipicolinate synthase family protein [Verrucomicrobiota bacterium]
MEIRLHLSGLIAAPFSPMHEDGRIDLAAIEHYARLLAEAGVMGAFVCGSTGESHS